MRYLVGFVCVLGLDSWEPDLPSRRINRARAIGFPSVGS
jgi:hypothetical protein